jgi:hypothetical protein
MVQGGRAIKLLNHVGAGGHGCKRGVIDRADASPFRGARGGRFARAAVLAAVLRCDRYLK